MAKNFKDLLDKQIELSYTPPQNFYLVADRLPELMFTLQRIQVPVISGEELILPSNVNPARTMIPGSSLEYSVLSCDFIIDKEFRTYKKLLAWMKNNYAPEDLAEQWKTWKDTMSDIVVIGTDADNTPLVEWKFVDCFPISLDGPMFDSTMPDIEYLVANVTFRSKYFEFTTYVNGVRQDNEI